MITDTDSPAHLSADDTESPAGYRSAPASIEAEQALLGALLVNNEAYYQATEILEPVHFFEPLHGRLFRAIGDMLNIPRVATPVTLAGYFEQDAALKEVGGAEYLVRLAAAAANVINVRDYARIVFELAVRRGLIEIGEDMVNEAYDSPIDARPIQQIEGAEQRLYELAEKGKYGSGFLDFKRAAQMAIEMAEAAYKRDSHLSGLSTGLKDLDKMLGGLQASDLIVLAARPAMGKTGLSTNIAVNVARQIMNGEALRHRSNSADGQKGEGSVAFFSLEMSAEQLATRVISQVSTVASHRIRRGDLGRNKSEEEESFRKIVEAAADLERLPLHIDDTGALSIAALASRARRLKRQQGLDLIIVDYIQLMQASGRKKVENRVQEITEITQGLKALAKELNVPVIALSQLSRAVEAREDKRPQLADLRESGSIEQDADVVMFIYREEYYHQAKEPEPGTEDHYKWQEKADRIKGDAEVIIGKQRHGPTGTVLLHFEGPLIHFTNRAGDMEESQRRTFGRD